MKPIFISVGHRVSLATAIETVKMTCRFRVPEPTRQVGPRSLKRSNTLLSSLFLGSEGVDRDSALFIQIVLIGL